MIDMPVTIGIMGIGGAWRDIAEDDCTADVSKTLGKRRDGQRSARRPALALKKIGMTGIVRNEHTVLQQRQRIALQFMPGGIASGSDACGNNAGAGREYGSVIGKCFRAFGEGG